MAEKRRFVLRLDERAMRGLERWAAAEFRSVNGQLEWLIARALKEEGRWPEEGGDETDSDTSADVNSEEDPGA